MTWLGIICSRFVHVQIIVPEGRNRSLCIATRLQVAGRYLAVLTLQCTHVDTEYVGPACPWLPVCVVDMWPDYLERSDFVIETTI